MYWLRLGADDRRYMWRFEVTTRRLCRMWTLYRSRFVMSLFMYRSEIRAMGAPVGALFLATLMMSYRSREVSGCVRRMLWDLLLHFKVRSLIVDSCCWLLTRLVVSVRLLVHSCARHVTWYRVLLDMVRYSTPCVRRNRVLVEMRMVFFHVL